jgi:hypothetical protein
MEDIPIRYFLVYFCSKLQALNFSKNPNCMSHLSPKPYHENDIRNTFHNGLRGVHSDTAPERGPSSARSALIARRASKFFNPDLASRPLRAKDGPRSGRGVSECARLRAFPPL